MVTSSEALQTVGKLIARIPEQKYFDPNPNLLEIEIFKSDVREFARFLPTEDIRRVVESMTGYGDLLPDEPQYFWTNHADSLTIALQVVRHRIEQGQIVFDTGLADEHLIEPGTPHSAYVILRDIVESTVKEIMLVDAWIDRTLFELLSNLKTTARIRFLTRTEYIPKDFVTEAKKFGKQTKHSVAVRTHPDVHDRFLVIDDRAFQSGSSFKDLGKKTSLVMEIKDLAAATIGQLETRWNEATVLL